MPFNALLAEKLLVETGIFKVGDEVIGLGETLEDGLNASVNKDRRRWKPEDIPLMLNMVLGTAAEIAMIRNADVNTGAVSFPVTIEPGDYKLAVWHTDTLPSRECITPHRLRRGELGLTDVTVFCADADKLAALRKVRNSSRGLRTLGSAGTLTELSDQLFTIDEDRTGILLREVLDSKYLNVKALIWNIKANLLTGQAENIILKEANDLIDTWKLTSIQETQGEFA